MIRKTQMQFWILCLLSLAFTQARAQGWVKKYSPDAMMGINALYNTPDGGCMVTGINLSDGPLRIMKIDAAGGVQWKADHDSLYAIGFTNITQNGGFVTVGNLAGDSSGNVTRNLLRTDANGNKLWLKNIHSSYSGNVGGVGNADVDTTDDGGFMVALTAYDSAVQKHRLYIKKIDANGNIVSQNTLYDADSMKYVYSMRNSKDGGFVAVIAIGSNSTNRYNMLTKIDGNGNFVWDYGPITQVAPIVIVDGNIILQGNTTVKVDQSGSEVWTINYPSVPEPGMSYSNFIERPDHNFTMIGSKKINNVNNFWFLVGDTLGNILQYKKLPIGNLGYLTTSFLASYKTFIATVNGDYLLGGWLQNDPDNYSGFLIKMDSVGNVYPSAATGHAFYDNNTNCSIDSAEMFLGGNIITFTNATDTFTVLTNDTGYYSVALDTGLYQISLKPLSPYWQSVPCNPTQTNQTSVTDTVLNFGFSPISSQPYIVMSSYTRPRSCMPGDYTIQYCNTGTVPFIGIVTVDIDTVLHVDSASATILAQNGSKYIFLAGPLGINECGTVKMYYTTTCDPTLTGHTICINAHAESDTIYNTPLGWDQSNLLVTANCDVANDSVVLNVQNVGSGNMGTPQKLIVIEDNVILIKVPVQLNSLQQFIYKVKANGSTFRAIIPQAISNPYSEFVTDAVEGCGVNQSGGISLHFINQYPNSGYYAFDDNFCSEIHNSYDPNHKSVLPEGTGPDHLIDSTTTLHYNIDFQNTGNDTAYLVRVTDTLADYLDPTTFRAGASSHPYKVELVNNVVEFTFYNINLPDSGTSQLGSNGYVTFTIKQKPGNMQGTVINNDASIYFDYNPAIVTNTATVKIGEVLISGIENLYRDKAVMINAYPNPFTDKTTIMVSGEHFNQMEMSVYDLAGRLVSSQRAYNTDRFILQNNGLSNGSYIFEIRTDNQIIGRGKIQVR